MPEGTPYVRDPARQSSSGRNLVKAPSVAGFGRARRSVSRGPPGLGIDGLTVGLVAGEASGPVEEGEGAV